jgi:histone H3/H4
MRTKAFPYTPFGRISKAAGAKRISDSALKVMKDMVLEEADEKSRHIATIAEHSGRKTVMRKDVLFAVKRKTTSIDAIQP